MIAVGFNWTLRSVPRVFCVRTAALWLKAFITSVSLKAHIYFLEPAYFDSMLLAKKSIVIWNAAV